MLRSAYGKTGKVKLHGLTAVAFYLSWFRKVKSRIESYSFTGVNPRLSGARVKLSKAVIILSFLRGGIVRQEQNIF